MSDYKGHSPAWWKGRADAFEYESKELQSIIDKLEKDKELALTTLRFYERHVSNCNRDTGEGEAAQYVLKHDEGTKASNTIKEIGEENE